MGLVMLFPCAKSDHIISVSVTYFRLCKTIKSKSKFAMRESEHNVCVSSATCCIDSPSQNGSGLWQQQELQRCSNKEHNPILSPSTRTSGMGQGFCVCCVTNLLLCSLMALLSLSHPQLAQILPTEENFLLCFRQHVGSSSEFMEVSREQIFIIIILTEPAPEAILRLNFHWHQRLNKEFSL